MNPPLGRFAIVAARFNSLITTKLVEGALDALKRHKVPEENIDLVWVPGSFEIPLVANKLAQSDRYLGIICLGCVIRGDTDHYLYIAGEAARGVARTALGRHMPVIFGILTCDTVEQALQRAGAGQINRGTEAAEVAIRMANLMAKLPGPS